MRKDIEEAKERVVHVLENYDADKNPEGYMRQADIARHCNFPDEHENWLTFEALRELENEDPPRVEREPNTPSNISNWRLT